jgi:hypothetical protein
MPALPSPGKVLKYTLQYALGEDNNVLNRFFAQYTGAVTSAILSTLAASAATAWNTYMAPQHHSDLMLQTVGIEDLSSDTGPVAADSVSHQGTDSGVMLPAATSMIIKHLINRRYRGGHPKVFLTGFSASEDHDPQSWNGTFAANTEAAWSNFITAAFTSPPAGTGTLTLVNVSYYSGFTNHTFPSGRTRAIPTLRGTPLVDPVVGFNADIKFASQRRRSLTRG